ncbi:BTB/POZ fold protein [Colletotrichum asianum]
MDSTRTSSTQSVQSATENPEIVKLHPSGDAIIVLLDSNNKAHGRFLVCSATLCLVSPYFRTLFGPDFKEGSEVRQGKCPEISLEEEEPKAMEKLLCILHFYDLDRYQSMEPRAIALLAQQSDKYDCGRALVPWSGLWFKGVEKLTKPEEYGFLLTAAYLLDLAEWFRIISATAIRHMPADFLVTWAKDKITSRLSWNIQSKHRPHLSF